MKQILVIEDNQRLRKSVTRALENAGYFVVETDSVQGAFARMRVERIDLILLDLTLGDESGLDILKAIRRQDHTLPIIIVSSASEVGSKLYGFSSGCDDYVTKPFHTEELLSRVRRQLELRSKLPGQMPGNIESEIEAGPFRLNVLGCKVYKGEREIGMQRKLLDMMLLFMRNPGVVISKRTLQRECWPESEHVSDNTMYVHVRRLRTLIEEDPDNPEYLQTLRGSGFVFKVPLQVPD